MWGSRPSYDMPMRQLTPAVLLAAFLGFSPALAQEHPPTKPTTEESDKSRQKPAESGGKLSVTDHEITAGGKPLKYKATAGTYAMKDEAGKPKASFFFVSYERRGDDGKALDPAKRPITYVFNGGPGAASVWLHMGTAGPKRVVLPADGTPPAPPYKLQTNEHSWLDVTDLVFIDPVGTGFSRPAEGEKSREWFGVTGDVESVGEFIRIFLTLYDRWPSPKFLAGESYGTTRAAGLSEHLHDRHGIDLNG